MGSILRFVAVIAMVVGWWASLIHHIQASLWVQMVLLDFVFFPIGIVHGLGIIFGWW